MRLAAPSPQCSLGRWRRAHPSNACTPTPEHVVRLDGMQVWQKRWFVLEDGELSYFRSYSQVRVLPEGKQKQDREQLLTIALCCGLLLRAV